MANDRWLMITPQQVGVQADKKFGIVRLGLDVSHPELGLAPGLNLGIALPPTEARELAETILRKANEIEGTKQ
ncbi:hypothetical protein GCM10011587_26780 [Pyruvatibacter mobilis]|nr:hypothetical protein GCM10011587_26780 [Pyruvatibacter mobilis]